MSSRAVGMPSSLLLRTVSFLMALKRICSLRIHAWALEKGLNAHIANNKCTCLHIMHRAHLNGLRVLCVPSIFAC